MIKKPVFSNGLSLSMYAKIAYPNVTLWMEAPFYIYAGNLTTESLPSSQ